MGRVAMIGDIGGHFEELYAALVDLGADPESLELPADLSVIQVGDLINRGPESPGCVALVSRMLRRQPEQWVQLVGNHESLHLPDAPSFLWPETHPEETIEALRSWWESGQMGIAAAVESDELGELLVTHAGVTAGFHRRLGSPPRAREAVAALERLRERMPAALWSVGGMMSGEVNLAAGPVWAEAGGELYRSWLLAEQEGHELGFGQVHGHTSAWWWAKRSSSAPPAVAARLEIDTAARQVRSRFAGASFIGIDPGFGARAGVRWKPLVVHGSVVARPGT